MSKRSELWEVSDQKLFETLSKLRNWVERQKKQKVRLGDLQEEHPVLIPRQAISYFNAEFGSDYFVKFHPGTPWCEVDISEVRAATDAEKPNPNPIYRGANPATIFEFRYTPRSLTSILRMRKATNAVKVSTTLQEFYGELRDQEDTYGYYEPRRYGTNEPLCRENKFLEYRVDPFKEGMRILDLLDSARPYYRTQFLGPRIFYPVVSAE